jgi:hypothetical protein
LFDPVSAWLAAAELQGSGCWVDGDDIHKPGKQVGEGPKPTSRTLPRRTPRHSSVGVEVGEQVPGVRRERLDIITVFTGSGMMLARDRPELARELGQGLLRRQAVRSPMLL